jgi:hypothetical protein
MFLISLSLAMQAATTLRQRPTVAVKQERKICRTLDSDTGSRMAVRRVCKTREQWNSDADANRRQLDNDRRTAPTGSIRAKVSFGELGSPTPGTGQAKCGRRARAACRSSPAGATSGNARVRIHSPFAPLQLAQGRVDRTRYGETKISSLSLNCKCSLVFLQPRKGSVESPRELVAQSPCLHRLARN